jgi:hypothetical protein
MECPFRLCSAWTTLIIEQLRPDDDELTVLRVPEHEIQGIADYRGTCPASLLAMPLNSDAVALLEDQARTIERMVADRQAARPDTGVPVETRDPKSFLDVAKAAEARKAAARRGEHGKTPHPQDNPYWFTPRSRPGDNPRHESIQGRPVLRLVPDIQEGTSVTGSHAQEANGLLQAASHDLEEIHSSIQGVVLEQLDAIQQVLATFTDRGDQINGMIHQAADMSQTYTEVQEVMATVYHVTSEQTSNAMGAVARLNEQGNDMLVKLAYAREKLAAIVF